MYVCMYVCNMYVCMYVCIFIKLHTKRNPVLSSESFYATRFDPPIRVYVCMYVRMYVCLYVCMYVCMYVCVYVCVCVLCFLPIHSGHQVRWTYQPGHVFIKLHITTQSGPVILVILCHSH